MREHNEAVNYLDVITGREEITVDYAPGTVEMVTQHDGSMLRLRKLADDYDVTTGSRRSTTCSTARRRGRSSPGCCTSIPEAEDLHGYLNTAATPFNELDEARTLPRAAALEKLNAALR